MDAVLGQKRHLSAYGGQHTHDVAVRAQIGQQGDLCHELLVQPVQRRVGRVRVAFQKRTLHHVDAARRPVVETHALLATGRQGADEFQF